MADTWKTIIIEDEELARQRLRRLLSVYPFIEIIEEAENGGMGLEMIEKHQPNLIFLDIEMPVLTGFELLKRLPRQPKVIFTTAYDQYAVKAFEEESVDYLLKPIAAERLEKSMEKLQQLQPSAEASLPVDWLMKQLTGRKELKTLTVKIGDRILLVKIAGISYIDAEDKYVFLNTADGKRYLTEFTLSALEEKLPDSFIRISRSTIINSELIAEIRKGFNGAFILFMSDTAGTKLSSGRSYVAELREKLGI